MRRRLLILLLLGLLLGALIVAPAEAITYHGGTTEQLTVVALTLESCWLDCRWVEQTLGYIEIDFRPDMSDYNTPDIDAWGAAWKGYIALGSWLTGADLAYVVAHEWAHQIYWAIDRERRWEWTDLCTDGMWDGTTWLTTPAENFAECMRVSLWPCQRPPATSLRVVPPDECRAFVVEAVLAQGGKPWRTEF